MGKSKLLLTPADEGMELSREEYAEAGVKGPWRYERARGRLIVVAPAGYDHHSTAEPIRDYLVVYKVEHRGVVEHVFQESWTSIDDDTDRHPDIAVYLKSSSGRIPERVPDLIFEIVSEGRRDRERDYEEKRSEYESIGVLEYVIVDRFEQRVTVLRLEAGEYMETVMEPGEVFATPLLPGLAIPLGDVL